jgi:hypothetical protein
MSTQFLTRQELAALIEQHAAPALSAITSALRAESAAPTHPMGRGDESESPESTPTEPVPVPHVASAVTTAAAIGPAGRLEAWRQVGDVEPGFTYSWPEGEDRYSSMPIFETRDARGRLHMSINHVAEPGEYYGRRRNYAMVFTVINGRPRQPLVIFTEADDAPTTGDLLAIIKGKGATKRQMFAPGDEHLMPDDYDGMRIELFRDRIAGPRALNRLAVVATRGDTTTMLDHALIQLRLRF